LARLLELLAAYFGRVQFEVQIVQSLFQVLAGRSGRSESDPQTPDALFLLSLDDFELARGLRELDLEPVGEGAPVALGDLVPQIANGLFELGAVAKKAGFALTGVKKLRLQGPELLLHG
jgi:hypothetical protein